MQKTLGYRRLRRSSGFTHEGRHLERSTTTVRLPQRPVIQPTSRKRCSFVAAVDEVTSVAELPDIKSATLLARMKKWELKNCFNAFVGLHTRRADLGFPMIDVAPAPVVFGASPVKELAVSYTGGKFCLKARVEGTLEHSILVQGPRPVRSSLRCMQHFPFLWLLPPPVHDWSDLTDLYVARYGVPKPDWTIWIRTCQHIDGWQDAPTTLHARISVQAA